MKPDQLTQWRRYAEAAIASLPQFSIGEGTVAAVCEFADRMMAEEEKRLEETTT